MKPEDLGSFIKSRIINEAEKAVKPG